MKPSDKENELAMLEARKQAILQGMGQGVEYPDAEGYESYGDHMRDVTPEQDAESLRQSDREFAKMRPLDASPYGARSQYPEQDSQSQEIAALQRRLKALQGY